MSGGHCRACHGAHRAHTCGRGTLTPPSSGVALSGPRQRSVSAKVALAKAVTEAKVEAASMSGEAPSVDLTGAERARLIELQNDLKGSYTLQTIAAAKELLDGDGECDRNALCAKHGITASPAAFERITAVVKQLGMLELPAGAVSIDEPADAAMLHDVQLLLQTANGAGGHSRSACALKTIAVAVEMIRVPALNFTASCARHDIRDALGHSKQNISERVAAVRDRILELKLLDINWKHSPIDRQLVSQVRSLVRGASIAQAAAAVGTHGTDLEAACQTVRLELGLPQPPTQYTLNQDPNSQSQPCRPKRD